ncbi:hypothetical protein LEP1GSC050_3053 [Leptospira broomii serovar Hurstbridge str. 5399]|uniref:Uncharacterized protein n=1 Tax=Leptospira broomii serovar Hurstbridge str. 5399 TaxID=1049789 RepID=T0FF04_9LEPT|nr:hypothetical protein LEP1GSC050_3053 [Leptospira broomii serovar Hurstbridge str. 5399]
MASRFIRNLQNSFYKKFRFLNELQSNFFLNRIGFVDFFA